MSYSRREKILQIIEEHQVQTQQQLADLLVQEGFDVTQATVSRDIKELKLVKIAKAGGKSCYSVPPVPEARMSDRFSRILQQTVQSIKFSDNIIVVNTLSGCANAAAEAIDSAKYPEILGSIAGDNTIFIVVDGDQHVQSLVDKLNSYIG
jgi:transcriptional regulator of arginine metabolism